jgi:tetratricopeptide (TPR) repeat protein
MHSTIVPRRLAIAVALSLVPAAFMARSVEAQDGDRMRLLVPPLVNTSGVKHDFGKKVADEVQKRLDGMLTHQPVEKKELQAGLKKYGLKEEDLLDPTCIKTMQFAGMTGIPLIMCGTYEESAGTNTVTAKIVNPTTQDAFEVPPFQASDPKQAADQIMSQFQNYVQQISLATYCYEYVQSQQFENAIETCDKALALNPRSKDALYNKGMSFWKLDRDEEALATLKELLEIDAFHQDAMYSAAIVATELGKKDEAAKYFHDYLELNPGNKDVRLKIATDAANAGDPEGALRILEEGLTEDSDGTMKMYAGHMAMNAANAKLTNAGANGNDAEGRALLEKALRYYEPVFAEKGNEVDPVVLRNMLQAYRKLEQTAKAVQFGQTAVAAHGDDAQLLSAYADALNDAGKRAEAVAMLDRIVKLDPAYPVNARRGLWLLQAGNLEGARTALKAAMDKGELQAEQQDQLAQQIAVAGYRDQSNKGNFQAAAVHYAAAKEFAKTPRSRGMISYFEGIDLYKQLEKQAAKQDAKTAATVLPRFKRVLELMEQAAAFTQGNQQNESSRQSILRATRDQIEIAELLIKRGR